MNSRSISSPDDQTVTFVELFFDLVFVFSITQVVSLFHDGLTWIAVGQAVLVFWLVWWGWSQFTWTLNAADTTHRSVQIGVLIATSLAFFMAIVLPNAYGELSLWFALTYVLLRLNGLILHARVAGEEPSLRPALRIWAVLSVGGLAAVMVGGYLGGAVQYWLWGGAILLDVLAAVVSGQSEGWNIHPEHFSERHGLFVIIALGETLIVAASGISASLGTVRFLVLGGLVLAAIVCALWWSYFPRAKPQLEAALKAVRGADRAAMARDVYSLLHFPMMFGVIAFAATVESVIEHPTESLSLESRAMLAAGLLLFVGGMALAVWRAKRHILKLRITIIMAAGGAILLIETTPIITFGIALAGLILIAVLEERFGQWE